MARHSFPGLQTRSGFGGKVLGLLILAVVFMLVVRHPIESAAWAKSFGALIGESVDGLSVFFAKLGH
jgi:hypothetical protein